MLKSAAARILYSFPALRLQQIWQSFNEGHLSERGMISQAIAITTLNRVGGDYMEFGLFYGRLFLHAYLMKRLHGAADMHLWGFDSFQGLPEVRQREDEIWHTGQFACSEDKVRQRLRHMAVPDNAYTLVPGFYDQTLNEEQHRRMAGRRAAVVYIDCDLYESTVPVLAFIEPYLQTGTVVCFDDYYCYRGAPDQGEQRAITEFLERHPDIEFNRYLAFGIAGHSFMVYRKPRVR